MKKLIIFAIFIPILYFGGNRDIEIHGDLIIDEPTTYENEIIHMYGNITVLSELYLINTTLIFHQNATFIAMPNSTLFISNCIINSSKSNNYSIFIEENVNFTILNSKISNFGWKDLERLRNATSGAEYIEYNRYLWIMAEYTRNLNLYGNDGLEIRSNNTIMKGNVFENYTSIRFYSSNNIIENNSFIEMKNEGLSFMTNSNNNIIRNNYFGNAKRMNREIYGLRFYPGTKNEKIYNNTFEWLPIALMVANIPPWDAGENFEICGNKMSCVIFGFNGKLKNSHIYNENYNYTWSPVHFEACKNLIFENSIISDVTFQKELEDVINQEYFEEVWERGLLPNMAYWMFGFYCSKIMIGLGWSGYNIEIRNNYIANAPPYTMAINFDSARGMNYIYIENNTFENIGNYVPDGYIVRNDWTGYNIIANITPLAGCCIMPEASDHLYVKNNEFINVLNGFATSSPDALGNFGNFTIEKNIFIGLGEFTWNEQRYFSGWWSGNYTTTKEAVGIAFGMHYAINYDWCDFSNRTYRANASNIIDSNIIFNFKFPIVIDYRRNQPGADEMGIKKAIIKNNRIVNYSCIIIWCDEPNNVTMENNEFAKNGGIFKHILKKGWNLITIPLRCNYTAKSLGQIISYCSIISKWDALNQTYISYLVNVSPDEFNFEIEDGKGYFVYVENDTMFYVAGALITNISFDLYPKWNLIGWYGNATNASSLPLNCTIISIWNASLQQFQSYLVNISPPEFDFEIRKGMGVFVYSAGSEIRTRAGTRPQD